MNSQRPALRYGPSGSLCAMLQDRAVDDDDHHSAAKFCLFIDDDDDDDQDNDDDDDDGDDDDDDAADACFMQLANGQRLHKGAYMMFSLRSPPPAGLANRYW